MAFGQQLGAAGMDSLNSMYQQGDMMSGFLNHRRTQDAQNQQATSSANNQISTTYAQMRAENLKTSAQNHQIAMETMTKTSEMRRETYVNRRKSSDKIHEKVKQLMMS